MKKYHSREVNDLIKVNLDKILVYFNISLCSTSKKYYGNCPIHANSDNNSALLFYKNTGIWMCTTHNCQKIFGRNSSGFIKGLLSVRNGWTEESDRDKLVSEAETQDFLNKFFNNSVQKTEFKRPEKSNFDKMNFIRQINFLKPTKPLNTRENFRKFLITPSEYYVGRGFSEEILDKYDVGLWTQPGHPFFQRTVVPIYDTEYQYIVGYTTRSLHQKCLVCGYFHDLNRVCPNKLEENVLSKWYHSKGFRKENFLYNYWFAKNNIESKKLIVLEGPSHCWRVAEAGYFNSVAYMGSSISPIQTNLIKRLDVDEIIIPADNDSAGQTIREQIRTNLGKTYKYRDLYLETNDIAELSVEEIKDVIENKG